MKANAPEKQGRLFYDGECYLCVGTAKRFDLLLRHYRVDLMPLQTATALQTPGLKDGEPLTEMKLLADDGRIYGGADAFLQIARTIWWAWPLYAILFLPGVKPLFHRLYRQIAAQRNCLNGVCSTQKSSRDVF